MVSVNVLTCQSGDIVANDIYDENGLLIIPKSTELNEYIINRLKNRGVLKVDIYRIEGRDEGYYKFRMEYFNALKSVKNILTSIQSGHMLDYSKLKIVANTILKGFSLYNNILYYLDCLKNYDEYTYMHSIDTGFYCMLIGYKLNLDKSHIENLIITGLLHDIGKLGIDSDIINKPGRLSDVEFTEMKRHTLLGYAMLVDDNKLNKDILNGILHHHERFDGSGYPYHLKGYDINLYGRIVAIADVYDAMTSDRAYKRRSTPFEAFEFFMTIGRSLFDSEILNSFLSCISTNLIGTKVILSNGNIGEIVYVPPHNMVSPIIKVSTNYLDLSKNSSLSVKSLIY